MAETKKDGSSWWLKVAGVTLVVVLLVLSGCRPALGPSGEEEEEDGGGGTTTQLGATARAVVDNLENDLDVETSLTSDERAVILDSVESSIISAGLEDSSDVDALLTTTVQSAQRALGDQTPQYADRSDVVSSIVGSAVGSINVGATSSSYFSRALSGTEKAAVLKNISKTSVSNLGNAGLTSDEIPPATNKAVNSMVTRLGKGTRSANVTKTELNGAIEGITSGAVESLGDAKGKTATGDEETVPIQKVQEAVNQITRAATSAAAKVEVDGVTADDVAVYARTISASATTSVKEVAKTRVAGGEAVDEAVVSETVKQVTQGATAAIRDIKASGRLEIATSIDTAKLVQEIATGAGVAAKTVADELTTAGVTVNVTVVVKVVVRSSAETVQKELGTESNKSDMLVAAAKAGASATATNEGGDLTTQEKNDLATALQTEVKEGVKTALVEEGADEATATTQAESDASVVDTTVVESGIEESQNVAPTVVSVSIVTTPDNTTGEFYVGTPITVEATVSDQNITDKITNASPAMTDTEIEAELSALQSNWIWYSAPANFPGITQNTPTYDTTDYTVTFSMTFTPWTAGTTYDVIFRALDASTYTDAYLSDSETLSVVEPDLTDTEAKAKFIEGVEALAGATGTGPDPDQALNVFTFIESRTTDAPYLPAILGKELLTLANVAVDPEIRDFATLALGVQGYPQTLTGLLDFEFWLESVTRYEEDGQFTVLMPRIAGQEDQNADGIVDLEERMYALMSNVFTNVNFNSAVDLISSELGTRLDDAITRIQALDEYSATVGADTATFAITWDMAFATEQEAFAGGWPYKVTATGNELVAVTIGTPELKLLASQLELIRSMTYMAKLINLGIDLEPYWLGYDETTGEFTWPTTHPLANGFLDPNTDADLYLADARTHALNSMNLAEDALASILARSGSAFFFDPTMPTYYSYGGGGVGTVEWDYVGPAVNYQKIGLGKMAASIEDTTGATLFIMPANFMDFNGPMEFMDYYSTEAHWPTDPDWDFERDYYNSGEGSYTYPGVPNAVAINLGKFYSGNVLGVSDIIELTAGDEPKLYGISDTTTSLADIAFTEVTTYTTGQDYYMKIKDVTYGGTYPVEAFPGGSISRLNEILAEYDDTGNFAYTPVFLAETTAGGPVEMYVDIGDYTAGHILVPEGQTYITYWGGVEESLGSFWRIPFAEIGSILPDQNEIRVGWINVSPSVVYAGIEAASITIDAYHTDWIDIAYQWSIASVPAGSTATTTSNITIVPPVDEWDVEGEDIEFMPDVAGEYTLQVQISGGDVSTVRQFVIRAYDATSGGGEIGIQ